MKDKYKKEICRMLDLMDSEELLRKIYTYIVNKTGK